MTKDNQEKLAIYMGPMNYPNGGAAAKRIKYVVKSLQDIGFDTIVATGQNGDNEYKLQDGIRYISLNERNSEHLPKQLKHLSYVRMGSKSIAWLRSLSKKPDIIVLYSGYSPYLMKLLSYCKSNDIRLIFDAVEWYGTDSKIKKLSPYLLNIELAMRYLIPKTDGVICISSFLKNYYHSKGVKTVFIPPTTDVAVTYQSRREHERHVNLIYAGSPDGSKDKLDTIVTVINEMINDGFLFKLKVIGLTEEQFISKYLWPENVIIDSSIEFIGRVSSEEAINYVSQSDFSILIRDQKKSSNAGFSTKFVESLSVGTPVIANLTGDIGKYLVDGNNGFIIDEQTTKEIKNTLKRVVKLNSEALSLISESALKTARDNFHYKRYSSSLDTFLEDLL
ncbi:glycosyltransferase [Vibrio breoganii]